MKYIELKEKFAKFTFFSVKDIQLGKTTPDFNYLELKLGINSPALIKDRLLEKCSKLDFKKMAADITPFLFNSAEASRLLYFTEYIQNTNFK